MKEFIINGREYMLPADFIYLQYSTVIDLLSKANVNLADKIEVGIEGAEVAALMVRAGALLSELIEKDIIPEIFACLLVPKEEKFWKKEFIEKNKEDMFFLTDSQMVEILSDFLSSKKHLAMNIMNKLQVFQKN